MRQLGMFKPLVVSLSDFDEIQIDKGTILGGRTRFYIANDLVKEGVEGFDPVWVSWVKPKDKDEAIAYALADNDSAGVYIEEELAELVKDVNFNLEDFKINLQDNINIKQLLDNLSPSETNVSIPEELEKPIKSTTVICPSCGEEITL